VPRCRLRTIAVAALAGALLAGCGTTGTPTVATPYSAKPRGSASNTPAPTATGRRTPTPSGIPTFAESVAVPCAGYPTGDQIVALLRRTPGMVPSGATATVQIGPLCAGVWQYAVVMIAGRDPLEVVTKGAPSALRLVTAGTDICTVEVRTEAPAGIRSTADC
jgi:hypothetical protein